ncbi:microtubule-destabilizing protein 60-like isoform X1 [Quercus robur]|uniref:microtubule-destabilizing protein 60-like isoform X1 n=1 Tax=Quercus robur TaxID=38942 RepID=UPI002161D5A9|nr:microtubule-destabilizing protein 60-like isoform X1 [Quercus robur]
MDLIGKNAGAVTPVKDPRGSRSKIQENHKPSENLNPNISHSSPVLKPTSSPVIKSAKAQKSVSKNPNPMPAYSPRNKIRDRKFVVAKKNLKKDNLGSRVECKCKEMVGGGNGNAKKCLCVAYENLRASQEEFFKNRSEEARKSDQLKGYDRAECELEEEIEKGLMLQDQNIDDDIKYEGKVEESDRSAVNESSDRDSQMGSSTIKRRRNKLLEEARSSVPESGSGRVQHLVKAFEKLLSIPSSKDSNDEKEAEENQKKAIKWALPGLQAPKVPETQVSSSSFSPSELFLTSENLGLDSRISVSSSWDSSQGSISSRTSNGGRRSRRNSSESYTTMGGRRWKKKQLKVTSQKPFKLRTEQRGRHKEEEFMKKLQEIVVEEERQRIPIAQGLPWTTDEPECLIRPPVKEITRPIDLKLHSDLRAVERAEFDHQVAEKMSLIDQYKMERERQQKLAEEEEIRRLRKELVPKAQPMPYFDRPFIPRRSMKHPTVPREPNFHIPQHKKIKCCLSWDDISSYAYQL